MFDFEKSVVAGVDKARTEQAEQREIISVFLEAEKAVSEYSSGIVFLYLGVSYKNGESYYKPNYNELFLSGSVRRLNLMLSDFEPSTTPSRINVIFGNTGNTIISELSLSQTGYPVSFVTGRDTFVCNDKPMLIEQMKLFLESDSFGRELLYKIEKKTMSGV